MATRLIPITLENLRAVAALEPAPHQQGLVAPNAITMAEASFYGERSLCRAVEHDGVLVGFVALAFDEGHPPWIWRLMIDHRRQGEGLGRAAVALAVELAREMRPEAREIRLSHVVRTHDPGPFYLHLGFVYTGEVDEDGERVMRLPLSPR
ncbi:MAG: hypothetical protein RIT28_1169 [Pseudomonadota bacterium]